MFWFIAFFRDSGSGQYWCLYTFLFDTHFSNRKKTWPLSNSSRTFSSKELFPWWRTLKKTCAKSTSPQGFPVFPIFTASLKRRLVLRPVKYASIFKSVLQNTLLPSVFYYFFYFIAQFFIGHTYSCFFLFQPGFIGLHFLQRRPEQNKYVCHS